jgi:hypothetical protein
MLTETWLPATPYTFAVGRLPTPDSRRQSGTQKTLPTIIARPTAQHVRQNQSETETKALKNKQT